MQLLYCWTILLVVACVHVNSHKHIIHKKVRTTTISQNLSNAASSHFFTQKLDHFDVTNTRTWKQVSKSNLRISFRCLILDFNSIKQYFLNDEFFDGTGPVFVMVDIEMTEPQLSINNLLNTGFWYDQAKVFVSIFFVFQ